MANFLKYYLDLIFRTRNEQLFNYLQKQNKDIIDFIMIKELEMKLWQDLAYFVVNYFKINDAFLEEYEQKIKEQFDVSAADIIHAPKDKQIELLNELLEKYEQMSKFYKKVCASVLSDKMVKVEIDMLIS